MLWRSLSTITDRATIAMARWHMAKIAMTRRKRCGDKAPAPAAAAVRIWTMPDLPASDRPALSLASGLDKSDEPWSTNHACSVDGETIQSSNGTA